ncbi:hypothetical protein B0H17DRAFT_1129185 [Mycena rosella]|uniref:Uncharacterized protein n=1 Tax=Mycena rosella TaxID=1033263 RepID=A0AAD7DUY3_MYCRO|nr:hypothetical protein B0H17DRAFT_1129185 [Mycena rosella]
MATLSRCGLMAPLPRSFDCVAHAKRPADRSAPVDMEIEDKNAENVAIKAANKTSITQTRVGSLDVGAPSKAMWAYFEDEVAQLIHAPELLAAVGPLPLPLLKVIA